MKDLLTLFGVFFKIGLFTFGGGLAMLPIIQKAAVEDYKWMTEEEMLDSIAVIQAMPGVIAINMATYVGNKKKGLAGAISATLGVILPSFIIIILAVLLLGAIGENKYVTGAFTGVKAAACGLIIYAAYKLSRQIMKGWLAWTLGGLAFVLVAFLGVSAIPVIAGGAVIGYIATLVRAKRAKDGGKGAE